MFTDSQLGENLKVPGITVDMDPGVWSDPKLRLYAESKAASIASSSTFTECPFPFPGP